MVLHEYDWNRDSKLLRDVFRLVHCQNVLEEGVFEKLVIGAGFSDLSLEDLTDEVISFTQYRTNDMKMLSLLEQHISRLPPIHSDIAAAQALTDDYRRSVRCIACSASLDMFVSTHEVS